MFSKMYPQILKNNKESQQSKETQERRIRKEQYDLISKYTMKLQWLKLYGNISRTDGSSGKINLCVEPIDLDKDTQTYERTGSSIYSIKKMENNKPGSIYLNTLWNNMFQELVRWISGKGACCQAW